VSTPEVQTNSKPSWLKVSFPTHQNFFYVSRLLKNKNLHTICLSAKCPNTVECWTQKTATFLILGDTCTRNCGFCAVKKGIPSPPEPEEATRIAKAISLLGIRYAVITSVTRDDLPDGGASLFSDTIKAIRKKIPKVKVEILIPDFSGSEAALRTVIAAQPDILNHNIEVPNRIYPLINRPKEYYTRSLKVLEKAKKMGAFTKSGLMVGLGEKKAEIIQTFSDLRKVSCDLLTIGQYLQPAKSNAPVKKFYNPQEFEQLKNIALDFGFFDVESGPMVRSSYRAHKMYKFLSENSAKDTKCAI